MTANVSQLVSGKIQLSPWATPGYTHAVSLTQESADRTSELLTINHTLYHTRWKATFHNHIVHHLLALWALGASPVEIQDMWDLNQPYQSLMERSDGAVDARRQLNLKESAVFDDCLGRDDHYVDFLKYFKEEIAERDVPSVVREYVLKGDERANDIFCRMYTDLVHPMIHLGCALEFDQPDLVAEALAAACIHDNWPKAFLLPAEEYARSNMEGLPSKSLLQLLESLRADPEIASAVKSSDPFNKIPDGFLKRVSATKLASFLGKFRVEATEKDCRHKMAEMMHTCAYMTGAAQRPSKLEAVDFVLLHSATLTVFYPAILSLDWLSNMEKARLIEAKARVDAVMYAGSGCPALYPRRIIEYTPRHPRDGWPELFHRSIVYRDEGHAAKLIRALFGLERLEDPTPDFPITKEEFLKIAHMAMDSIERTQEPDGNKVIPNDVAEAVVNRVGFGGEMVVGNMARWVFYGGLDSSWNYVPNSDGLHF
ncbi:hypothetical protein F4808DRAFT_471969 [Astrocystis sublimbata]|nr:hypothetical protein F4808DRAFT_471969 [Astrocystis sublimbata]